MKFIISWNSEVLQLQLLAGPLSARNTASHLEKIVIQNLMKLSDYSKEEAEKRYRTAVRGNEDEEDELVVYSTGASIRYGSGYEEYYHIVDYKMPLSGLCMEGLHTVFDLVRKHAYRRR